MTECLAISPYAHHGQHAGPILSCLSHRAPAALDEFAESADRVLTRRVRNSPPERDEARWLPGWRQRLRTYRAQTADS